MPEVTENITSPTLPCYKQTEVGVIPEEWDVRSLDALATMVASGRSSAGGKAGDYPVHGSTGIIGYTAKPEYEGDAILAARVGANAGKLSFVSGRYGVTDNTIMLRLSGNCYLPFFWRQLETKRLNSLVFGSGQPLITGSQLKALPLAVPPFPEQRAIATALSDVDALLGALDRLIAKKRDLKQAAMQQLLTGQTRLPGFKGEWVVKRLGEECGITTGRKDVNEGNPSGEYPFFTCAREHTFSDSFSFEGEAILIAGNGEVGNLSYFKGRFEAYQRTYVLQKFTMNVSYLWHQLSAYLAGSLGIGKIGSSIPYILKGNLLEFEFRSPVDMAEQTAIAAVLSDMDAELAVLEQRQVKTRALKQGMMQELLTGRTRLI